MWNKDPRIESKVPTLIAILFVADRRKRRLARGYRPFERRDRPFTNNIVEEVGGWQSGTLIDDQHILTCAHGLLKFQSKYEKAISKNDARIEVYYHNVTKPIGEIKTVWILDRYIKEKKIEDDYAVRKLKCKLDFNIAPPLIKMTNENLLNNYVMAVGYPYKVKNDDANKPKAELNHINFLPKQYNSYGQITSCSDSKTLQIKTLVTNGNSGGGIYMCDSKSSNDHDDEVHTFMKPTTLIGIGVNTGGESTGDSFVAIAMNNTIAAFISLHIDNGHLNYDNLYARYHVKRFIEEQKNSLNASKFEF